MSINYKITFYFEKNDELVEDFKGAESSYSG